MMMTILEVIVTTLLIVSLWSSTCRFDEISVVSRCFDIDISTGMNKIIAFCT